MKLYLVPLALAILPSVCRAQFNYLVNPGFETWDANDDGKYTYSYTGDLFDAAGTGAVDWAMWNAVEGTTTTERVTPPAGLTDSGNYSAYITTTAADNGIEEFTEYLNQANEPEPDTYELMSGWVYVTQGSAGLAWFNYDTQQDTVVVSTSTLNQWVYLSAVVPDIQSAGFVILGLSANSDFYADNMLASPTPEPATSTALGLGAFALLRRRRGRKVAA